MMVRANRTQGQCLSGVTDRMNKEKMKQDGEICNCCEEVLLLEEVHGGPKYCSTGCAIKCGVPEAQWPHVVVGYEE